MKKIKKYLNEMFQNSIGDPKEFEIEKFLGPGRSTTYKGSYDLGQLKMGIEVEKEHTNNPKIAERITKDHLAEIPDYYTRLAIMEKEGKEAHG
jgi:hypothetical protein